MAGNEQYPGAKRACEHNRADTVENALGEEHLMVAAKPAVERAHNRHRADAIEQRRCDKPLAEFAGAGFGV